MSDLASRRVIEALRTGVPTHDAVIALGAGQPHLEERMTQLLRSIRSGRSAGSNGFVFNGDFGTGKSHLLEAFSAMAVEENFIVSRAVISKNLPLHSSTPVLVELIETLRSRTHAEDALLTMLNDALDSGSKLDDMLRWSNDEARAGRLAPLFPGLLSALRRVPIGTHPYHTIVEYLSGAAVPQAELNALFRAHAPYIRDHAGPRAPQRAEQTVRFLSRLFIELGYSGWIVLFDELELIRLQGPLSRGKAYAEVARWMGLEHDRRVQGLGVVGTVTRDFVNSCITGGSFDVDHVPAKLRASASNFHLADAASEGMEFLLDEQGNECSPPDTRRLEEIQESIRRHYASAFDCTPSRIKVVQGEGVSVRAHIRRWITMWDLERQGRRDSVGGYEVAATLEVADEDDFE